MNNSQLFKKAHAMTKQVIKKGDSYNVTFGICLKQVKADAIEQKQKQKTETFVFTSVTLFMMLAILAVACGLGVVAVVAVKLSVITLASYSLKNEFKPLLSKIKSKLSSIDGIDFVMAAGFTFLMSGYAALFVAMVTR